MTQRSLWQKLLWAVFFALWCWILFFYGLQGPLDYAVTYSESLENPDSYYLLFLLALLIALLLFIAFVAALWLCLVRPRHRALYNILYGCAALAVFFMIYSGAFRQMEIFLEALTVPSERLSKQVHVSEDGKSLEIRGIIDYGFTGALEKALQDHPSISKVTLEGPGGHVVEGVWLGRLVRRHNLAAYVYGECNSTCAYVFLSAPVRILGPKGRLGFHGPYLPGSESCRSAYIEKLKAFYRQSGISASFIDKIFSLPEGQLWQPGTLELLKARVVTAPGPARK